jgi:hypothetical protein
MTVYQKMKYHVSRFCPKGNSVACLIFIHLVLQVLTVLLFCYESRHRGCHLAPERNISSNVYKCH